MGEAAAAAATPKGTQGHSNQAAASHYAPQTQPVAPHLFSKTHWLPSVAGSKPSAPPDGTHSSPRSLGAIWLTSHSPAACPRLFSRRLPEAGSGSALPSAAT